MLYNPETKPAPLVSWGRVQHLLGFTSHELKRIASEANNLYRPFDLRRLGTSKWRHIDNPLPELKFIQKRIDQRILRRIELPSTMFGAISGRTIRDNALFHRRQPLIVTLDLKDCFPSTNNRMVYNAFVNVVNCSTEIASVFTRLTTYQCRLPQGAPSSPAIANITLLPLHADLLALAESLALRCTFFIDDIVVSGARANEFIEPAIRFIRRQEHSVRQSKIARMPRSQPQRVTGVLANRGVPSVGRNRRDAIRYEIFELSRDARPAERALQQIRSKIAFVRWISSTQASSLTRLANSVLPESGHREVLKMKNEVAPCKPSRSTRCLNS